MSNRRCTPWISSPPMKLERVEELGSGSFGTVHRVLIEDSRLGPRPIEAAMKVVNLPDEAAAKRFVAEIEATMLMSDLRVYGAYLNSSRKVGVLFVELVPGREVFQLINENLDVSLYGFNQAADLLIYLLLQIQHHWSSEKAVHRDIKPENVLLTPQGRWRLLDYGLTCRSASFALSPNADSNMEICDADRFVGTPAYASRDYTLITSDQYPAAEKRRLLARLDSRDCSTPGASAADKILIRSQIYAAGATVYMLLLHDDFFDRDQFTRLRAQPSTESIDELWPTDQAYLNLLDLFAQHDPRVPAEDRKFLAALIMATLDPQVHCENPEELLGLLQRNPSTAPIYRRQVKQFNASTRRSYCT